MRSSPLACVLALLLPALLLVPARAEAAATIRSVTVTGLDDEAMEENIQLALSLNEMKDRRLGEARLQYLLTEAAQQASEALEPFGYYNAVITVQAPRSSDGTAAPAPTDNTEGNAGHAEDHDSAAATATAAAEAGTPAAGTDAPSVAEVADRVRQRLPADPVDVVIHVELGEPVRVRNANIRLEGPGEDDRYLNDDLAAFTPLPGQRFDHTTYETSKLKIVNRLAERGYFDADFLTRRVEVTRADNAADIDLSWATGIRYDMGPTHFHQDYFDPGLLEKLVYWEEGSYFHQGKLDRLRESLVKLDYFSNIDIRTDPDLAEEGRIPVDVTLTRAKRTLYTAGLSYGTENGPGVRLGIDRRYVNSHGHKLSTELNYTRKRKIFSTQYRIPAFNWLDGWYGVSALYDDDNGDYIDSRRYELTGSRSGQVNERVHAVASLHVLNERWRYFVADDGGGALAPVQFNETTLLYPSLRAEYVDADDPLFPRDGLGLAVEVRGGIEGAGSDTNFIQVWGRGHWYRGIGERNRLIVRVEGGHTYTDELVSMPPSLRFFAGGDHSIRGYQYREVGPTDVADNGDKYALGAKNVLTGTLEFEHYFNDSWGAAAFVDTGDAFDDTPDFQTGVGIGARWRSPVGPVRIDIARGLDHPDSSFQIYLNIGADW